MIESNVWLERAGLFELLAKSFSFPAFDLAAALASGEYSQASREVCHAWGITDVRLDALLERVDDKYAGDEDTALHALRIHPAVHRHPRTSGFALRKLLEGDCRGEGPRSVSQSRNVGSGKRDARGGRRK